MTVSQTNIWRSASQILRQPAQMRDKHLDIGGTLRDLYFSEKTPKTEGAFSRLLDDLDTAEEESGRTNS